MMRGSPADSNRPKRAIAPGREWRIEIGAVEGVEELPAELHPIAFTDRNGFDHCAWGFSAPCKNASDGAVAATVPNALLVWRCCCGPQLATWEATPRAGILFACGVTLSYATRPTAHHSPDEAGQFSRYSDSSHRGALSFVD